MTDPRDLIAALQRDIADRLRPVCVGLSDQSFDQLVREIAAFKLKYDAESGLSASLRRQLEQVMSESAMSSEQGSASAI